MGPRPELSTTARRLLPLMLVALLGLSFWRLRQPASSAFSGAPAPATFAGETMGTTYSIKLAQPLALETHARIAAAIEKELETVSASMSTYRHDSELSTFNRTAENGQPFSISEPLRAVLRVALEVGKRSHGALDITVGPAVQAWGFGPGDAAIPDADRRARLLAHIGLSHLQLTARGLARDDSGVRIDLSSVAKGYAVDRVADRLESLGYHDFLVEVGGELRGRGHRADGATWQVGIEQPVFEARKVERVVALSDRGMATSGDYRNFVEHQGRRRSHLLDPRTAEPVVHALASVSVLHARAAVADAWATALSVLGPEDGPKVAEREGISALFIVRERAGGFRSMETSHFSRLVGQEHTP